jgi:hypothetical protein
VVVVVLRWGNLERLPAGAHAIFGELAAIPGELLVLMRTIPQTGKMRDESLRMTSTKEGDSMSAEHSEAAEPRTSRTSVSGGAGESELMYVGFWKRLGAYTLDLAIFLPYGIGVRHLIYSNKYALLGNLAVTIIFALAFWKTPDEDQDRQNRWQRSRLSGGDSSILGSLCTFDSIISCTRVGLLSHAGSRLRRIQRLDKQSLVSADLCS